MLRITLSSYTADLDEAQLSIVMTSPFPLMAEGSEGGNYIFNFSLPAMPGLKKVFRHAHRPASAGGMAEVPFSIDASGIRFTGVATLSEAGADFYEVMCPVGNGSFNMRSKEVKLPALELATEIGSQVLPLIAESGVSIYFDQDDDANFTLTKTVPFTVAVANTDELSADGLTFTAASARNASVTIRVDGTFNTGLFSILLFQNDAQIESWAVISGSEILTYDLTLAVGDTIQVKFTASAEQVNAGYYVISGALYEATRLTIGAASFNYLMATGATSRWPDVNFAVFPVENPRIFDAWPDDHFSVDNVSIKTLYSEYFTVINYWHGGTFPSTLSTTVNDEGFEAGNLFVPFPYIAYLVERIANYFGFRIVNNVFEDELKYAVLINFFVENNFLTDDPTMMSPNTSFRLNDHVPDWSVYDFLQHLCHLFGLGYEVNDEMQTLTFTFVKDMLESSTVADINYLVVSAPRADFNNRITGFSLKHEFPGNDALSEEIKTLEGLTFKGVVPLLSGLPASGNAVNDCWYVFFSYAYYAWQYDPEAYQFDWVFHSRRHKLEISSGTDPVEISTQLPAVVNVINTINEVKSWAIPASHQPGIFEGAPDAYNQQWAPLVAWYHGLKTDSNGATYPYGSSDCVDSAGNLITDVPFSLKLDGFNNLFDAQWKYYLNWRMQAKAVRVQIVPDRAFLKTFRFSQKVRIGGVNYLVAELRGNIGRLGPDVWEMLLLVV